MQFVISRTTPRFFLNFSVKLDIVKGQRWHVCYFSKNFHLGVTGHFDSDLDPIQSSIIRGQK